MPEAASTQVSLLIRLRDTADADAWGQFVEIYSPLVFNFARRCGMQESDAADLVQEVMGEVTKSIARFDYDPQIGRFRSWLYKIAKRTIIRLQQRRKKQPTATGDSETFRLIANQPDAHDDVQDYWDREYQSHLINWAADKIQGQFRAETWQAFWQTSVLERSPQEVASELGMSVGSVYVAKSRVMKRLAEKIQEIDDSHGPMS